MDEWEKLGMKSNEIKISDGKNQKLIRSVERLTPGSFFFLLNKKTIFEFE